MDPDFFDTEAFLEQESWEDAVARLRPEETECNADEHQVLHYPICSHCGMVWHPVDPDE